MTTTKPTAADDFLKELLTTLQKQWNILMDNPDGDLETRTLRTVLVCDRFCAIWYLAKLIKLDPDAADETTKELQDVLNDGGAIGEWAWDMLTQLGVDPNTLMDAEVPA